MATSSRLESMLLIKYFEVFRHLKNMFECLQKIKFVLISCFSQFHPCLEAIYSIKRILSLITWKRWRAVDGCELLMTGMVGLPWGTYDQQRMAISCYDDRHVSCQESTFPKSWLTFTPVWVKCGSSRRMDDFCITCLWLIKINTTL